MERVRERVRARVRVRERQEDGVGAHTRGRERCMNGARERQNQIIERGVI